MYLAVSRPAMVMLVSFLVPKKMPVLGFASLVCSDLSSEGMLENTDMLEEKNQNKKKKKINNNKKAEQKQQQQQQQVHRSKGDDHGTVLGNLERSCSTTNSSEGIMSISNTSENFH
jgi:hypothetical protein